MTPRGKWITFLAMFTVVVSLIAAAFTRNPNWPLNIPIGLISGAALGALSWPMVRRTSHDVRDDDDEGGPR